MGGCQGWETLLHPRPFPPGLESAPSCLSHIPVHACLRGRARQCVEHHFPLLNQDSLLMALLQQSQRLATLSRHRLGRAATSVARRIYPGHALRSRSLCKQRRRCPALIRSY